MDFLCVEKACTFTSDIHISESFVMTIPVEACVDKDNIATIFCPHCGSKLKEKKQ